MRKWTPEDMVALRKAKGWTQRELAEHSGYSEQSIEAMENGRKPIMKWTGILFRFLQRFGPLPKS